MAFSMQHRRLPLACLIYGIPFLTLLAGASVHAQEAPGSLFPVSTFELKNGLQVILSEDYTLPVVSVAVVYKVGSRDETENMTGMAHFLENLMFQGSRNVRPMQHIRYIQRLGGRLNARTTRDTTLFYQTIPSNQLATVLWLESDRMLSLDITQAKVTQARNNILEEIRRNESNPFHETSLRFDALLYPNSSIHHPISGYENDVRNIDLLQVRRFYETYYRPNNAILCVTGHMNKSKTVNLIRKYFESIPRGEDIYSKEIPDFSDSEGQSETMVNPLSAMPGVYLGYRMPSPGSIDYHPAVILEYLLFRGNSGRLSSRLLRKERTAVQVDGRIDQRAGDAVLRVFILSSNTYTRERSLRAIQSEVNRLKTQLVSESELNKAKSLFRRDFIKNYSTPLDRALFLLSAQLSGQDLRTLGDELAKYIQVSPARVGAIVHRYLNEKRTMLKFDTQ